MFVLSTFFSLYAKLFQMDHGVSLQSRSIHSISAGGGGGGGGAANGIGGGRGGGLWLVGPDGGSGMSSSSERSMQATSTSSAVAPFLSFVD